MSSSLKENILDALSYVDRLECCVKHPLSSYFQGSEEEEGVSDSSLSKGEYHQFQVEILKRQIDNMIKEEMKNCEMEEYHPNTTSSYEPQFSNSTTGLSEHYKQMIEKQEFVPFFSEKEKEEYLETIKKNEPLYYYHNCIHTELAKNYGEESLRKANEYLQKQIKLLEREKTQVLQEIENINKKRKREQYDLKYELDKLIEKSTKTNHLIFKLARECTTLESLNKKLKQSRENKTEESSSEQ
ncbi:predicted protein [Naegleria gruberi]|uniref:Predicted protein n=1 Tax=Naegleria gruberi TaxID=5762 RepID=D2VTI4_NAEGR|nr:uncharacterized protein NAEGRDRAFT_72313 [Naegleria gruberi]EFC39939.1 predicted protein [Naegleria gruberi]|eukprot:XP_002672683.1 predicted protein [Naegleria gruberi strain NEG-M]